MSNQILEFIYQGEKGQRLDKYLVDCLPQFSRSRIQGLIKDGFVLVNAHPITKAGFDLEGMEQICVSVPPPVPVDLVPEAIPLDILYENNDVMVVNKPAGMVVHPAAGHASGTLIHAALSHAPEMEGIGGEIRPGVVHRLDKDTSGIILLAKNERSHRWLQDQFRLRKVTKIYIALVDGKPPTPQGRVEAAVGRDPSHRKKMAIVPDSKGREAISEYYTVETFTSHTLLEVHPLTGRTHQIRLHMAFLGCPIVGDPIYGHRKAGIPMTRHFLHAARLTIKLLGEEQPRTFEAPLPDDLDIILKNLRRG